MQERVRKAEASEGVLRARSELEAKREQERAGNLVRTEEQERRRIARELHDEIGQVLTVLGLSLEMTSRQPAETREKSLEEARRIVNDLLARVRNLSLDLRPPMLDDLGLLAA